MERFLFPKYDMPAIFEAITNNAVAPAKFWIVFDIPTYDKSERTMARISDIANGTLHGVKGISDSKQILTGWWIVCRNAAVIMDSRKVIDLNDVEKINYDDPDHLCQDDFRLLYRIWDKKRDRSRRFDGMMMNLMNYFVAALKSSNRSVGHYLDYYGTASKVEDQWQHQEGGVHDLDSAAHWLFNTIETVLSSYELESLIQQGLTSELVRDSLRATLLKVGQTYSDEAEWLVHGDAFHIPPQSQMMIGVNMQAAREYARWLSDPTHDDFMLPLQTLTSLGSDLERHHTLMTIIQDNHLAEHYRITYVDARRFEEMRPKLTLKRRIAQGGQ